MAPDLNQDLALLDAIEEEDGNGNYRFRVEGITSGHRSYVLKFDETYEIEGEHPAEALEKLLREIEWGILDSEHEFTISYLGIGRSVRT